MSQDHYAVLGVVPTAPAAVIRAAYLALMREYHPDRNPSATAAEQSQAVIAAYKVLGDFDRRSAYDWDRRREREAAEGADARPKRRKAGAVPVMLAATGLAAVGALALMPMTSELAVERAPVKAAVPAPLPPPPEPPVALAVTEPPLLPAPPPLEDLYPIEPIEPVPEPVAKPVRIAAREPVRPPRKAVEAATQRPPVLARPRAVAASASPSRVPPPTRVATTDLASIDQFALNYYGQSWRFGDAPKRAVLERTRADYVVRRGACAGETCKRAEALKLMRDVSAIVEGGEAKR